MFERFFDASYQTANLQSDSVFDAKMFVLIVDKRPWKVFWQNMENELKLAIFLGGIADNKTKRISHAEPRLHWDGFFYICRGEVESKKFGTVWIYVLEKGMTKEEEERRVKMITS